MHPVSLLFTKLGTCKHILTFWTKLSCDMFSRIFYICGWMIYDVQVTDCCIYLLILLCELA